LPPHAFGSESDHLKILNNSRLFLIGKDGDKTKLPPLYTRPGATDVEDVLWKLHGSPNPHTNAGRDSFRVYFVWKLFHEFRNATLGITSAVILHPNFSAEHELINNPLEFTERISCDFHEI
jgi:hypothetical protein